LGDIWLEKLGSEPNLLVPNKLGSDPNFSKSPALSKVLALAEARMHLYGKSEARKGRKMGHLTITAPTADEASAIANQAATILGIAAF